jgi:hypothetical protein
MRTAQGRVWWTWGSLFLLLAAPLLLLPGGWRSLALLMSGCKLELI